MARPRPGRETNDATGLFAPVSVARASSSIVEQIRGAIVGGRLREGERLPPERELAEEFGVSRVTVRDALRALEAIGLVEVRVGARGGAFVTAPTGVLVGQTMSDMMMMQAVSPAEIVEARLIVELGTVTLACSRATAADLARLRESCDTGREALQAKTYTRELSWDFHTRLAESAHNTALDGLTQSFRSSLSLHPIRTREGAKAHERTVEEHARIVDALERRDEAEARHAMALHLLRGTRLEKQENALLALWSPNGAQPSSRRTR